MKTKDRAENPLAGCIPYAELTAAMVLTASHVVVGKLVIRHFPVFFASGVSMGAAALLFFLFLIYRNRSYPRVNAIDMLLIAGQAFAGVFLFRVCILYGLGYTGAIEGGIILSTTPAVVGVVSFLLLKETPTWSKALAILLALVGITVLNIEGSTRPPGPGSSLLLGNLLLFGAVLGEAGFTILRKIVSGRVDALVNASYVGMFSFFMFVPFVVYQAPMLDLTAVGGAEWAQLFYYGTVVPVGSFILWFRGVSRVQVSTAGVFTGVLPVSSLILSNVILHERIRGVHGVGMVLVFGALFLAVRGSARKYSGYARISGGRKNSI
ncbi:MAG: DMT family transporter [Spirochaetota bacterium]